MVLRGNLAPGGCVIKPSAASPRLFKHRGRALVFESVEHMKEVLDDEALDVDADSVMVLKGAGPVGYVRGRAHAQAARTACLPRPALPPPSPPITYPLRAPNPPRPAFAPAQPGMPEVGNMPLPKKVLRTGVTDMVRISH